MSKILILLCSISLFAQTPCEKTVLDEAKRRNINTVEQALEELNRNGISQSQARVLARQQSISFDAFLNNNFNSTSAQPNTTTTADPDTAILLQPPVASPVVVNYKPEKKKSEGKFLNDATNILSTVTGALTPILLLERL